MRREWWIRCIVLMCTFMNGTGQTERNTSNCLANIPALSLLYTSGTRTNGDEEGGRPAAPCCGTVLLCAALTDPVLP